jgi:hypothetical protein
MDECKTGYVFEPLRVGCVVGALGASILAGWLAGGVSQLFQI